MNAHEKERNEMLSKIDEEKIKALKEQPVKIDIRKELASIEFMGVNDARDSETIARHFYELGKQSGSSEKPSEGLEEEIKSWHKRHFKSRNAWDDYSGHYLDKNSQLDLARHFAQWGAEHLKK